MAGGKDLRVWNWPNHMSKVKVVYCRFVEFVNLISGQQKKKGKKKVMQMLLDRLGSVSHK